jgi:hypothetical protein
VPSTPLPINQTLQEVILSAFHLEVAQALGVLGLSYRLEETAGGGLFDVDMAIQRPGKSCLASAARAFIGEPAGRRRATCVFVWWWWWAHAFGDDALATPASAGGRLPIGIEVDGPTHFTVNLLSPLGGTILRRRCIRAVGWDVMPVPFTEW